MKLFKFPPMSQVDPQEQCRVFELVNEETHEYRDTVSGEIYTDKRRLLQRFIPPAQHDASVDLPVIDFPPQRITDQQDRNRAVLLSRIVGNLATLEKEAIANRDEDRLYQIREFIQEFTILETGYRQTLANAEQDLMQSLKELEGRINSLDTP